MSYDAVFQVTRALRMLLHSQLTQVSGGAVVTLLPPGEPLPDSLGVNLYLYRVQESPSTRNQPWRGDRITPASPRPALGLQLFYLLTPLGTRPEETSFTLGDDAHTMLGLAMLTLQENPILNHVHLPGFDADSVLPPALLNSFEQIKITLTVTSLDELSKIWATINQPYRLSVAYEVSLVELTPTVPTAAGGGIVLSTGVKVVTLDAPRLDSLVPPRGALASINGSGDVIANALQIRGSGLSFPGQDPVVRVGGQPAVISASPAPTDLALTVALPTTLDAGPQADVAVTLIGRTSTPLPFVVVPWLASLRPIRTALDPANGAGDLKLALSGNGFTTPQSVRFDSAGGTNTSTTFDAGGDASHASITIPTALPNGLYQVRLVLSDKSASNSRAFEVMPLISSPIQLQSVTVSGVQVHQLTLNGARLNGVDVRLMIDGVAYVAVANANPSTLVYTLGRLLDPGSHRVGVRIDGHASRTIDLEV